MKKVLFILFFLGIGKVWAQNYNNILNYALNNTPQNGVKIKTNIPFTPGNQMPTINIKGFNYVGHESIDLTITYYIYSELSDFNNPSGFYFYYPSISSAGGYTPTVKLANEGGKVVIFIDDKSYYQRFTISAFAVGMNETSDWFADWSAVDEPLSGSRITEVPYKNRFSGDVYFSKSGIWNTDGNVGIGTVTPKEKLSVNGNIRAKEVKVEATGWPDYVFKSDYKLTTLAEIERNIKEKGHLPGMPSAKEVEANGVELGDMNKRLLQKIEELTLHLIAEKRASNQEIKKLNEKLIEQNRRLKSLERRSKY